MKKLFFKIMGLFKESEIMELDMSGSYYRIRVKIDGKECVISMHEEKEATDNV